MKLFQAWTCGISGLILALCLAGCPCDFGCPAIFYEDFENFCADSPCGWELVSGQAEQAVMHHPAEHGVRLTAGSQIVRPFDQLDLSENWFECDQLTMIVDCDPGATLSFWLELQTNSGLITVVPSWQPDQSLWRFDRQGSFASILRLGIKIDGAGACVVDSLFVTSGQKNECNG